MTSNVIKTFIGNRADKIIKITSRNSDVKMNLLKSYGIIAVVCSHTTGGAVTFPMCNWFSPFYYFMPLFVFASGYFYSKKYDSTPFFPYMKSKFSSLIVPYFIWNVVYGLINTLVRSLEIIRYGDPLSLKSLLIRPWVDGHQYHFNIAAWFMLSLFIDILVIFLLRKLMSRLHIMNELAFLALTVAISVACIILAQKGYNKDFSLCLTKAGFMLPYFQLGVVYKKYEHVFNRHRVISMGSMLLILYICLVLAGSEGLNAQVVFANFRGNPALITITTTVCIMLTALVCDILAPAFRESKVIRLIGDNTFSVMMHHGIVIFGINFALYVLNHFIDLASFDVQKFQSTLWYTYPWRDQRIYIIYVIAGVTIPIVMKLIYNKIILALNQKLK